jgi:2-dehydropantoate 2-reductase
MADAGVQDVVLLTLKAHQVKDVLPDMRALFGPHTSRGDHAERHPLVVLPQAGRPLEGRTVESRRSGRQLIAAHIEPERIIGSVVYPASELVAPGVIKVIEGNRFTLGELDGSAANASKRLAQTLIRRRLQGAGQQRHPQRDLAQALGQPQLQPDQRADPRHAGGHLPLPADARTRREGDGRGAGRGEKLGVKFKVSSTSASPAPRPSARTRPRCCRTSNPAAPLELEALVGSVRELGRITETPTPTIDAVYACAKLLAVRRSGLREEPNEFCEYSEALL